MATALNEGVAMILARAPRPASPPPSAVVIGLAEFRIAQSLRALAAPAVAPPDQPYPWAYVIRAPKP
jgi:hypothetical protein